MSKTTDAKGSLTASPVRRWSRGVPKLLPNSPYEDPLPVQEETTKIALGFRFLFAIIVVMTLSFVGALALLGTTILPVLNIEGNHWIVQRAIYIEGQAPLKSVVLSLGKPLQRDMPSRVALLLKGSQQASIVQIVAKPLDKVSVAPDGQISINGIPSSLKTETNMSSHVLGDQYLGICISGDCGTKGDVVEIPTNYVLGKVLGSLRFGLGLGSPPSYQRRGNV